MQRQWIINPEWDDINESVRVAKEHAATFEYTDFFNPSVYLNPEERDKRVAAYLSLGRDTSKDTLHAPFYDVAIASMDSEVSKRSKKIILDAIETARELKCRGVVLHSGILAGLRNEMYKKAWLTAMEPFYREICGDNPGITFYLENTLEETPELLVLMAKRLSDVPNFALCFDYAHACISQTSVETWVREMGPFVGHVHVNDTIGRQDLHLTPGKGDLDFHLFATLSNRYFEAFPVLLELAHVKDCEEGICFLEKLDVKEFVDKQSFLGKEVREDNREEVYSREQIMDAFETNLAIAREKNKTKLLNLILNKSMELAGCDAGTLYILKDNLLHFKIMKTKSQGVEKGADGTFIDLPPVEMTEKNVCAYSAMHATKVNIKDVYQNSDFDFSGPKKYDAMTGYLTRSMLTVPLMDQNGKVLGVMQFLNAQDANGELTTFDKGVEHLIEIMSAQAAITLQQVNYIEEIRTLIWDFAYSFAEAIDQRTPYNGSHTRMVAKYSEMIADKMNEKYREGREDEYFDDTRKEQLVMAALLHDIGKMVVPLSVMNKATRLGNDEEKVFERFKLIEAKIRLAGYEGKISQEEESDLLSELTETVEIVKSVNAAGFVPDELEEKLVSHLDGKYSVDGEEIPFFTESEKVSLQVRKGTLTAQEREIMENHVVMTKKILENVHFNSDYKMAPIFAAQHHECMNGKGYPNRITDEELYTESKILAVADICDALLATDRPYKKAMPKEKAFGILYSMAEEGNIEKRYVQYLEECLAGQEEREG